MEQIITFNRNELYEKVWSEPMSRLAPEYSISDRGLAKICMKLNVPIPPRGYWAKLEHGKKTKHTPLPALKAGETEVYTYHVQPDPVMSEFIASESKPENRITVSEKLLSPHILVRETHRVLMDVKTDNYGVLRTMRKSCLDMRISPQGLKRALRIMDALIKGFEKRKFRVKNEADRFPSTYAEIDGENIHFSIEEKVRQIDHVLTKEEQKNKDSYSMSFIPRWDYIPTGILRSEEHTSELQSH